MITAKDIITLIEAFDAVDEKQKISTIKVSINTKGATPVSLEGLEKVIQKKLGSAVKNITRTDDSGKMSFEVLHDDAATLKTNLDAMIKKLGLTGSSSVS